jgi:uncharacterized protein
MILAAFAAAGFLANAELMPRSNFASTNPSHTLAYARRRCRPARVFASGQCSDESNASSGAAKYSISIVPSISAFSATEWNFLARQGTASPFLEYDWLRCLEESGSASKDAGWIPQHLSLRDAATGDILAAAPCYLKLNSLGEFVFDSNFADASYSIGVPYYPKLLIGIPFTPAAGRRVLTSDDGMRCNLLGIFADAVLQVCSKNTWGSAHINFCEQDEAIAFSSRGYCHRLSVQYHWKNPTEAPYESFDDFLSRRFNSKKRIKIRRERSKVRENALDLTVLTSDALTASDVVDVGYEVYVAGIDKQVLYGRQYLSKRFFELLSACDDFRRKHVVLVVARSKDDASLVAGTFNVVGGKDSDGRAIYYGRYWGSPAEMSGAPPVSGLHFEACYYQSIEYCLKNGLGCIQPGAGGGESKCPRGFDATPTNSCHYFFNSELRSAAGRYIAAEREYILDEVASSKLV